MLVRMLIAMSVLFSTFAHAGAWENYKSRFVMPDGRVVDTGNGNISHTEGQGFAMLMAVSLNDRQTFDKLWKWTESTLKNKDTGLFYWRYNPVAPNPIADKNDATDGDMMIAWALLKAQKQWRDNSYGTASDNITSALLKHTVITYAGYKVMLPGANGFNLNSRINLNPSYFIFPAWQAFADRSHLVVWRDLLRDGKKLVGKMGWGNANLPTDWVALSADGKLKPADEWKPRTSYDAIRIPLYIRWQEPQSPLLAPWKAWWQKYPREKTPAWVNVLTNETSPYPMNGGLMAVRDFTLGDNPGEPQITVQDDYYSASLKMLTWLAERDITQ
ncbi:MAG TPA: glycosyl hydrolase family 8 [Scandinavium sp.]|uniref:glycosyl hydrolase family 8 n=1 Tax=Scandinavium sp. TaxID=2830653 RepID=UPI002E33733E|nr:glycosyl hydrolase family 8 [Scandinavium sp.]HEX4503437.1 glycosyl hydrolase family 8 [Scandinavium sp.]